MLRLLGALSGCEMSDLTQRFSSLRSHPVFEQATSRRLLSVALLCLGVANLVWLNGLIYPRYRGQPSRSGAGAVVPERVIAEDGEIDQAWMKSQLELQTAFVVLPFEAAGYLPKLYLAQIRNFAIELVKRKSNYWVLVSGSPEASSDPKRALRQSQQRVSFVRDLLVQSGLHASRVLMEGNRGKLASRPLVQAGVASPDSRKQQHLLLEIRVLEVQSQ